MRAEAIAAEVARRAFEPPTRLTASQWADAHGWIARSSGASEAGRYATARAPYLREILDVCGDEDARDVVFSKPAQVGFTEGLNQLLGYWMAEDPSGVIVIQPNVEMAKSWSKERIDPMLAESPRLRGMVRSEGGRRTSDDTMQRKVFRGGWLVVVGANAPSALRSRPARRVLGDERSGWTLDARGQGDPWDLAVERTATFWNAKRIQGSTPGEEGTCPVTDALLASDLRRFHVACPSCGHREPFSWRAPDGRYRLVCETDAAGAWVPASARYLCVGCGVLIPETEKARMLAGGQWIADQPGRAAVGFHLNGLVSPWRTWSDIIELWLRAQGNQERLKVFVTHVLAEPWRELGERIEAHTLAQRVEPAEPLPPAVGALVGSVDVQADRLEALVLGVGAGEETWCLEYHVIDGNPTQPEVWAALWHELRRPREAPLLAVGVDTGFLTDDVWRQVDATDRRGCRVFGLKGVGGRGRPLVTRTLGVARRGVRRPWLVGTDTAKDMIANRLRLLPAGPGTPTPGALHFADGLPPEWFDGLTSEQLKVVIQGGRPTRVWRPIPGRRNEPLDLLAMAFATLHALGAGVVAKIGPRAVDGAPPPPRPAPPPPSPSVALPGLRRPGGGWVNGWRR